MAFIRRKSNPELEPKRIPSITEIAWAAGVYEGEGSIRGYNQRSVLAQMCQRDAEVLYRLRDLFGGSVGEYSNAGFKKRSIYKWTAGGDKARIFFALVYPYLTNRRKAQVDSTTALDFLGNEDRKVFTLEEVAVRLDCFYQEKEKQLVKNFAGDKKKQYWCEISRNWRARKRGQINPNVIEIA